MINSVVCNAFPFIGLQKIDRLDILWDLFDNVYLPHLVIHEIAFGENATENSKKALQQAMDENKVIPYKIQGEDLIYQFKKRLPHRETEVIIAAKELNKKVVLIDELSSRGFAERMGLYPLDIIGLLLLAKKLKKIETIQSVLDELIKADLMEYKIDSKPYNRILFQAEEIEVFKI